MHVIISIHLLKLISPLNSNPVYKSSSLLNILYIKYFEIFFYKMQYEFKWLRYLGQKVMVKFPVMAHAWIVGSIPSRRCTGGS